VEVSVEVGEAEKEWDVESVRVGEGEGDRVGGIQYTARIALFH